jgi:predicted nucleic acid-binding protein
MRDRVFIDTNILIYFISDDLKKKIKAKEILFSEGEPVLSSQVINEFINACLIKNLLKLDKVISLANKFMDALEFSLVKETTIKKSLQIKKAYNYSYWDCLIIASALENNCATLYTEDMQNGHVIENRLKIVNPFV